MGGMDMKNCCRHLFGEPTRFCKGFQDLIISAQVFQVTSHSGYEPADYRNPNVNSERSSNM